MPSSNFARPAPPAVSQPSAARVPLGSLTVVGARSTADPLIRRLALDRLRDLRDDGVTLDYVGRMYGVDAERVRELEQYLRT